MLHPGDLQKGPRWVLPSASQDVGEGALRRAGGRRYPMSKQAGFTENHYTSSVCMDRCREAHSSRAHHPPPAPGAWTRPQDTIPR